MTGIMQVLLGGGSSTSGPVFPAIGAPYGGGFVGGKISTAGTGVADYYLIVAPKATGQVTGEMWAPTNFVVTGATSVIDGPSNTATIAALGSGYAAAYFCANLSIDGYTDWYLPAKNELEVLYYNLKPGTTANNTSSGSNANAVAPEPISNNYTSGAPAQTVAGINFRLSETEAFDLKVYYTSTEISAADAWAQYFDNGNQFSAGKGQSSPIYAVRAVRRVPV